MLHEYFRASIICLPFLRKIVNRYIGTFVSNYIRIFEENKHQNNSFDFVHQLYCHTILTILECEEGNNAVYMKSVSDFRYSNTICSNSIFFKMADKSPYRNLILN